MAELDMLAIDPADPKSILVITVDTETWCVRIKTPDETKKSVTKMADLLRASLSKPG